MQFYTESLRIDPQRKKKTSPLLNPTGPPTPHHAHRGHEPEPHHQGGDPVALPHCHAQLQADDPAAGAQRGPGDLAPAARRQGHGPVPGHTHTGPVLHAVAPADEGALEAREAQEELCEPRDHPAHRHEAQDTGGPADGEDAHAAAVQCEWGCSRQN